ncbi:transposase [Pseudomonas lijiangensis]|uniref:Transposase n=1 Tax=Pseudomonas lijiangensis TaxID=2995658 RepID=A0ABX8HXV0_9PSED|nr:transposase [Pseudomonas lijiangensis]
MVALVDNESKKTRFPGCSISPKYIQRNIIGRMFGWLKESRRGGTRYDKLAKSFETMTSLACAMRCLRLYFS